jgi:hypothetical protein
MTRDHFDEQTGPKGELRWLLTPGILKSICKKGVK